MARTAVRPQQHATTSSISATTSLVASMDSVIGLDFKNEMPIVITKTIAATVTKAWPPMPSTSRQPAK
jgi:hypothetical protein